MRSRSGFAGVLIVAAVLAGCVGCAKSEPRGSGAKPITVGAIVSTTGSYAALGTSEEQAIKLELERINAGGGVHGRPVEVIFEDDGTDEAKAVAAAGKLIGQQGAVALIGASGTGQSMAVRGEIDRAGIAQISLAGGSAVTKNFDPLVFQTPWPNKIVVPFVLDAMSKAGRKRVGLISDSSGYGKDGRGVILDSAKATGVAIVADETFNPGDTDMTAQLTKIRSAGADSILMWTAGREAPIIVKNAAQLKLGLPVYGGSGIAKREFIAGAGAAAEGVEFGTGKALVPESYGTDSANYKAVSDFASRYKARYGSSPDVFAGHAYDALHLLVGAMERLPADFTAEQLRDELEKTKGFVGFDGTFTFSPSDHNGLTRADLQMYRIRNGEWELADR